MTKFTFKVSGEVTDAQELYEAAYAEAVKSGNEAPEEWLRTNGEIDVVQCVTYLLLPCDDVPGVTFDAMWTDEAQQGSVLRLIKPKDRS